MNLNEIGYHMALADLGLEKDAGFLNWAGKAFSRGAKSAPKSGPGVSAMDDVERFAAGRGVRKPPSMKANARAEDAFAGVSRKARTPAAASATPPSAGAPTPQAMGGGLLGKIQRNPLTSVGVAGLGAGGVGYTMGMGAPPPGQPMQQYDPQQQQQMGYQ